jgi:hypothetical protein
MSLTCPLRNVVSLSLCVPDSLRTNPFLMVLAYIFIVLNDVFCYLINTPAASSVTLNKMELQRHVL